MTVSLEQAYAYARAAGATDAEAKFLAAVAVPESGLNPTAHNPNAATGDDSYGLWQINMLGAMGVDRARSWGLSSYEQLFDPATNAMAAVSLLRSQGQRAWTTFSSGAYMKYVAAATAAGDAVGDRFQTYLSGAAASPASNPGGVGVAEGAPIQTPKDGVVYDMGNGYKVIAYDFAPGLKLYYELDAAADMSGLTVANISPDQWNASLAAGQAIKAGSVRELGSIARDYGSYAEWWGSILNKWLAPGSEARQDPGVLRVLAMFAARPDMSPEELTNLLKGTDYYKSRSEAQLAWNDLPIAEQQLRVRQYAEQLRDQYFQLTGASPQGDSKFEADLTFYATQVASGQKGLNEIVNGWIKQVAVSNPESPWSRTLRQEQENQRQRPVDIENQTQQVLDLAHRWGVQLSGTAAKEWGQKIIEKSASDADLLEYLKNQAQVLYPWKDREMETRQAAEPWIQTFQRVMERQADVYNPMIQEALQQGVQPWQFEQNLKARPEWMETKNAQETLSGMVGDIGRRMGFS